MKFSDIRQVSNARYDVDISWLSLQDNLDHYNSSGLYELDLDPEFQRGHVWTKSQQIAYVEFILTDNKSGRDIYFNCPGWGNTYDGPMTLVDGKQRITAVLQFLNSEIKAFGYYFHEFEDKLSWNCSFKFHINNITDYNQLLQWYINLNSGVAHTSEELNRVRSLLK